MRLLKNIRYTENSKIGRVYKTLVKHRMSVNLVWLPIKVETRLAWHRKCRSGRLPLLQSHSAIER